MECLTEIASLNVGNMHDTHFEKLYVNIIPALRTILSSEADIARAYDDGSEDEQAFIQQLSLFFTGFFKAHLTIVEKSDHHQILLEGHNYLTKISYVDDIEIFKICLEYWSKLVNSIDFDFFLILLVFRLVS